MLNMFKKRELSIDFIGIFVVRHFVGGVRVFFLYKGIKLRD